MNFGGINERIFIECNRKQLRGNYSNTYSDFYFETDSEDSDLSDYDYEVNRLFQNQFHQSFCFTELRLYNFILSIIVYVLTVGKLLKWFLNQNYIFFKLFVCYLLLAVFDLIKDNIESVLIMYYSDFYVVCCEKVFFCFTNST